MVFLLSSKKDGDIALKSSVLKYPILFSFFDLKFNNNLFPT